MLSKMSEIHPGEIPFIIQALGEKLKAYYVFPAIAEKIKNSLQTHLQNGDYSAITKGDELASILSKHLQEINQDKHLRVQWCSELLDEHEGALSQNPAWLEDWQLKARLDNFGFHKAERLPGNIGYLDIHKFDDPHQAGEAAVGAMNFLANTDILIIDLRQCQGGDPGMVALISSYLFGEERVHLNSFQWREDETVEQYWTLPYVPGKRYGDKPIFVLTSKETFSGGEEFAYNLKCRKRATLVGETTRGGANIGAPYRVHPHLEVFIPIGQAINPITGTNWEGCGVIPDMQVTQEHALQVAYRTALGMILKKLGDEPRGAYRGQAEEARAALADLGEG